MKKKWLPPNKKKYFPSSVQNSFEVFRQKQVQIAACLASSRCLDHSGSKRWWEKVVCVSYSKTVAAVKQEEAKCVSFFGSPVQNCRNVKQREQNYIKWNPKKKAPWIKSYFYLSFSHWLLVKQAGGDVEWFQYEPVPGQLVAQVWKLLCTCRSPTTELVSHVCFFCTGGRDAWNFPFNLKWWTLFSFVFFPLSSLLLIFLASTWFNTPLKHSTFNSIHK